MKQEVAHKATIIVAIVFGVLLWSGAVEAKETFAMLEGIPVQILSGTEMAAVEGKLLSPILLSLLGPVGLSDLVQGLGDSLAQGLGGPGLLNPGILDLVLGNGGPGGALNPAFTGIPVTVFEGFGGALGPGLIPIFP